jgi:orotate phosphoribosyltransferase
MTNERAIARSLMEIGAVSLRAEPPFVWASGRLSPIYCDNRLLMSSPARRKEVARGFAELVDAQQWSPQVIAGTATAGIPHAAWLADLLDLPMVYVRGSAKGHGKGNRIEGRLDRKDRVVLIEDLISTGGSSLEAAGALVEAGAELLGVAAIFTYGLEVAARRFAEAGVPLATLTDFDQLMEEALAQGELTAAEKAIVADWKRDPGEWSASRGGAS